MRDLYVDSSVVLRALLGQSPATVAWFRSLADKTCTLVASRLGLLEVRRVAFNAGLSRAEAAEYTGLFAYMKIDDRLIDEADAIAHPLKAADSLHLATALRFGTDDVDIVTHDLRMATAARGLGFQVIDPVTDDPHHAAVA